MKKPSKFYLIFKSKEKISKDTYTFNFKKPYGFEFDFGQYLKLTIQISKPDSRGSSRYFTISSSIDDDFIAITTKIIKSSYKLELLKLKKDQKVSAFGPIGYFDFDLNYKNTNVFLASGIGITPFYSIIRYIHKNKINSRIILLVSFSKEEDVIFFDELKKIEGRNENIKIIYTLTKEKKSNFEKGKIDERLINKYVKSLGNKKYFIVGSMDFENYVFELLKNMNISEREIFKENFPGY